MFLCSWENYIVIDINLGHFWGCLCPTNGISVVKLKCFYDKWFFSLQNEPILEILRLCLDDFEYEGYQIFLSPLPHTHLISTSFYVLFYADSRSAFRKVPTLQIKPWKNISHIVIDINDNFCIYSKYSFLSLISMTKAKKTRFFHVKAPKL